VPGRDEVAALDARGIGKRFSGVEALADVDLCVAPGEIHGVVGPNGAGKTTLLNVMSGYVSADRGTVAIHGLDVTTRTPASRVPLGLVRTFQNIRLFAGLSVSDNVAAGQHHLARTGLASLWPLATRRERKLRAEAEQAIERFGLREHAERLAGTLPYGLQKQVELARAVVARPRVLLLDEPAAGMPEADRATFAGTLRALRDEGITIVVVEHDMNLISATCDRVTVLNFGRLLASGPTAATLASDQVRVAYVGE